MLNEKDIQQLNEKGITKEGFLRQIDHFKKGFPPLDLDRPATVGDGILRVQDRKVKWLADHFSKEAGGYRITKFIPASGAATRMFRDVFVWRDLIAAGVEVESLLSSKPEARMFFERISDFAFWDDLALALDKDDLVAEHLLEQRNYLPVLDYLLFDYGLDYASLPKALIAFHMCDRSYRTPLEEHMVEGADYACDIQKKVRLHFTLSPEHIQPFRERLKKVQPWFEENFGVNFEIAHSVQKPSTDTIAVGKDNLPFREKDGSLVFRPGGHGALIDNLNEHEDDLIFIKNIDNVVPDRLKPETLLYKKVLGGLMLELQKEAFAWLHRIDKGRLSELEYTQAVDFAVNSLNIHRSFLPEDPEEGQKVLHDKLNRPLRVCGMVKNEGEPGGGPFWVKDPEDGSLSLQIVEMSQINRKDPQQEAAVERATHFNPVDLVCAVKDYKGQAFDLKEFIDPETGFISYKSKDGRDLKALERPGLWNGAMARWNTVFVEVPLGTFNPVKTINDLLRDGHQGE